MASLNQIQLIGNVGRTPDVRTFDSGSKVVTFSLAVTERYKNRSGEQVDDTTWFDVCCYQGTGDFVERYVTKGSQLFVQGRMRSRSYTNRDGVEKYVWEVIANTVTLLDRKSDAAPSNNESNREDHAKPEGRGEDDLPF